MNDRRAFLLTAGSAAMTLATCGWLAAATPPPVMTSLLLPLAGVFFQPTHPCVQGGENAQLSEDIHVVTQSSPSPRSGAGGSDSLDAGSDRMFGHRDRSLLPQ
jgi:hypothetical protein